MRKAILIQGQTAAHQRLGQISLMGNWDKLVGDLVNEASRLTADREQVMGVLSGLQSTRTSAARLDTSLCAHLYLTVRDAEYTEAGSYTLPVSHVPSFPPLLIGVIRSNNSFYRRRYHDD